MRQEAGVKTSCQQGLKGVRGARDNGDTLETRAEEERNVGGGDGSKTWGKGAGRGDQGLGVCRGCTAASAPGTERRFLSLRVFVSLELSLYFVH